MDGDRADEFIYASLETLELDFALFADSTLLIKN